MVTVKDIIARKPSEAEIENCKTWPVWDCAASKFDWDYTQTETCLLIEGQVTVTDRPDSGESVSFGQGDFVIFPNGLQCIWDIKQTVKKYYDFS